MSWARGRHFHVIVLAAFVCAQRHEVMKIPLHNGPQLFRLFSQLRATQYAAPLLAAARELEGRKGVLEAVEETMGAMAFRSIV